MLAIKKKKLVGYVLRIIVFNKQNSGFHTDGANLWVVHDNGPVGRRVVWVEPQSLRGRIIMINPKWLVLTLPVVLNRYEKNLYYDTVFNIFTILITNSPFNNNILSCQIIKNYLKKWNGP